jgi:hypothetical protein
VSGALEGASEGVSDGKVVGKVVGKIVGESEGISEGLRELINTDGDGLLLGVILGGTVHGFFDGVCVGREGALVLGFRVGGWTGLAPSTR